MEHKLFHLEREIAVLTRVLDAAKEEESRLRISRCRFLNQRCIINRIPEEVLSMIFEAGNPCSPSDTPVYSSALAGTCYLWRTLALRSPKLWRYIRFRRNAFGNTTPLDKFHAYVERSKASPLYLEVGILAHGSIGDNDFIMDAISPLLSRCHELKFVTRWRRVVAAIFPLTQNLLALKHFALECDAEEDGPPDEVIPLFASPPPNLQSIYVLGNGVLPSLKGFDTRSITYARLETLPVREVLEFLQDCPSLETLRWQDWRIDQIPAELDEIKLSLPSLVVLEVFGSEPANATRAILAPQLQHLSIGESEGETGQFSEALQRTSAFPNIRSLAISALSDRTAPEIWARFIAAHTKLEALVVECPVGEPLKGPLNMLRTLSLPAESDFQADVKFTSSLHCPHLQVVGLMNYHPGSLPDTVACDGVRGCLQTRGTEAPGGFHLYVSGEPSRPYWHDLVEIAKRHPHDCTAYPVVGDCLMSVKAHCEQRLGLSPRMLDLFSPPDQIM